jgi:hypothetical protein
MATMQYWMMIPADHGDDHHSHEAGAASAQRRDQQPVEARRHHRDPGRRDGQRGPHPHAHAEQRITQVGGEGHERAVGDVEHVADPELHGEAHRAERDDRAGRDAEAHRLDEDVHPESSRWTWVPGITPSSVGPPLAVNPEAEKLPGELWKALKWIGPPTPT